MVSGAVATTPGWAGAGWRAGGRTSTGDRPVDPCRVVRGGESYSGLQGLRERAEAHAGDFVYIPAGTPHLPVNASSTEACVALVAGTDPNEQESVVLLPELDGLPHLH